MKPSILLSTLTLALGANLAQAAEPVRAESLAIPALSRCDASFFQALAARADELQALAPLRRQGAAAAFVVKPHPENGEADAGVSFAQPVSVAGLPVVGYFDNRFEADTETGGSFLPESRSWGYYLKTDIPTAAKTLKPQIWDSQRLHFEPAAEAVVRSELWRADRADQGWRVEKVANGVPPAGVVERVLLIEPGELDGQPVVRLGCSLQGRSIPKPLLQSIRIDLAD